MKTLKIAAMFWVISGLTFAQIDTTNWYPLEIGNKWQFSYYVSVSQSFFITIEVIGDTTINQKKYSILKSYNGFVYQRVENNNSVYEYSPYLNQEYKRYDFTSPDKSIWNLDSVSGQYGIYATEHRYISIFEDSVDSKVFNSVYIDTASTPSDTIWGAMADGLAIVISKGLGITEYGQGSNLGAFYGAVINGDTLGNIVGVEDYEPVVSPNNFVLFQNYPNPFNPSTTIKYSIASVRKGSALSVQLIVYDILGREIATLVNKKQLPGNYSVIFDASNLPSGIYFYKIECADFSQTNKMLLLK